MWTEGSYERTQQCKVVTLFTLRLVTHKHTPLCLLMTLQLTVFYLKTVVMILASTNPNVRDFAYVQDMWRLSPPCWNSLCGNTELSCFPMLLLTPAVEISAAVHRKVPPYKCTRGDTWLGQVHPLTHFSLRYHYCSHISSLSNSGLTFSQCVRPVHMTASWGEQ